MGIRRDLRLTQPDDFARLRRGGRVYRHRLLMLSVLGTDSGSNRYGIITGKRIGKAVVRNRVRRLIQEVVQQLHPQARQGYDMVFVAHPACVGQSIDTLYEAICVLYRQAGLVE